MKQHRNLKTFSLLGAVALAGAIAPLVPATPALAATAAEMQDLPQDHWAYAAIQQLIERYGVMQGFPDNTFQGTKTVSRYELAAALTRVMQRMDQLQGAGVAAPSNLPPLSSADQATVARLKLEFKKELNDLEGRVTKTETGLKELQDKLSKMVTVKGSVTTVLGDETLDIGKDRTAPYIASGLALTFKGNVSDSTSYDTAIGGNLKAAGSGDVPSTMGGLGRTPTTDAISLRTARVTTKVGGATVNVGRFPLWLAGFGPYSDLAFRTGDFIIGAGSVGPDVSALRMGSDVGASIEAPIGPLTLLSAVNSNIIAAQMGATFGLVGLKAAFETDHKAITQQLLNTTQRVKTTYNAGATLDIGGEAPFGGTLQANITNDALTSFGGGLRASLWDIDLNGVVVSNGDPGKNIDVLSFCAALGIPAYEVFGGAFKTPGILMAATDNYTYNAPGRSDQQATTGAGGQALGKSAGVSLQLNIANPLIPGLVLEYNAQAKLVEDIFIPNASDPITSESIVARSTVRF